MKKPVTEIMIGMSKKPPKSLNSLREEEDEGEGEEDHKLTCAEELIAAVKSGDAGGVVDAFGTLFGLFESEPHEEADVEYE